MGVHEGGGQPMVPICMLCEVKATREAWHVGLLGLEMLPTQHVI